VMQDKRTKYLIHDVAAMISISAGPSLNPGDVIYTGTPVQTSALKPGDVVGVKIEGVGVPRNPAQAE